MARNIRPSRSARFSWTSPRPSWKARRFAIALERHPQVFPQFYRASIAAGEQSGKLSEVLAHLTEFVAARERAGRKIQLALLYPALLAGVSLMMITLLLVYVVPDIVKVFVSRGAALPLLTRALIGLSGFVQAWGLYVVAALALAAVAWARWVADPANARRFARFRLTTPPFAGFTRQLNAARFAGSLATLVRSDVPLVDALRAAAAVTPNAYVRERAELARPAGSGGRQPAAGSFRGRCLSRDAARGRRVGRAERPSGKRA